MQLNTLKMRRRPLSNAVSFHFPPALRFSRSLCGRRPDRRAPAAGCDRPYPKSFLPRRSTAHETSTRSVATPAEVSRATPGFGARTPGVVRNHHPDVRTTTGHVRASFAATDPTRNDGARAGQQRTKPQPARGRPPPRFSRATPGLGGITPGVAQKLNHARATPRSLAGYILGGWVGGWVPCSRATPGSERVHPGLHKISNQARAIPRDLAGYTRGGWVGGRVGAMQPLVLPIRQMGRQGYILKWLAQV